MPNRHEGKITGLSAHGETSDELLAIFEHWFSMDFLRVERFAEWKFAYSNSVPPIFLPNYGLLEELKSEITQFSSTTIAATIQKFTEEHVLQLLMMARELNLFRSDEKICLSGGLFSNVRLNQRILQFGFSDIFVAPAMTDDGTALGAAISVARKGGLYSFTNRPKNVYLGKSYSVENITDEISKFKIDISKNHPTDWKFITDRLLDGDVFAIFSGRSEFGPRALGNRSLVASPHDESINIKLNTKLQRTDFMPFAPVIRDVDYKDFFEGTYNSSLPYMTITANARSKFADLCPAVVHVDGTARPQVLSRSTSPYLYDLVSFFYETTGIPALINTSFNIHEEPIIDSPFDALRGFLISDIDWLVFENEYLISSVENHSAQLEFLHKETYKTEDSYKTELIKIISKHSWNLEKELMHKEEAFQAYISYINGGSAVRKKISNMFLGAKNFLK
jgi:carbamoyltransferase